MQDNIKFYLENLRMHEEILQRKFNKKPYLSKNGNEVFVYKYKSSAFKGNSKSNDEKELTNHSTYSNDSNHENQYIIFLRKKGERAGTLLFKQNIRKNWINYKRNQSPNDLDVCYPSALHDLKYGDFIEIINVWAEELQVANKIFWSAKVTKIELGVNLVFQTKVRLNTGIEKLSLSKMLSSVGKLKNVEEKHIYGSSGICFKAQNFELSFYDKLKRMIKTKEVFGASGEIRKVSLREKLNKERYFLRFELRILEVSKFNQSAFKNKIETLNHMKNNWNLLLTAFFNLTNDLTFFDFLSPEIEQEIINIGVSKSKKTLDNFMIYSGLKYIGYDNFKAYFLPLVNKKIRSRYEREMVNIYSQFRMKTHYNNSYEHRFISALYKKLESLKLS